MQHPTYPWFGSFNNLAKTSQRWCFLLCPCLEWSVGVYDGCRKNKSQHFRHRHKKQRSCVMAVQVDLRGRNNFTWLCLEPKPGCITNPSSLHSGLSVTALPEKSPLRLKHPSPVQRCALAFTHRPGNTVSALQVGQPWLYQNETVNHKPMD